MNKAIMPFQVKSADDLGNFVGWASTFGNVDSGDDVIAKNAKVTFKAGQNGRLKLALYHDLTKMAGNASFNVSEQGIKVEGKLNLNVSYVKDAYELMKDGTLDEMSIGFNITDYDMEKKDDKQIRVIKGLDVWEASIVPFGMNDQAQIQQVKSIRDFEGQLRTLGYSQKEAKALASHGFASLKRDVLKDDTETVECLKNLISKMDQMLN